MVSLWRTDSYFNNEPIQIGDVEIMTATYGSSGSFLSVLRSKYIGHNTYTGRRSHIYSKPILIHRLVHKYYLNYSYSRSHFSWLPQAVAKRRIFSLSKKVSYVSNLIDPVTNGFNTHEVISYLHIFDLSIVKFGIRVFCLGFSKHSYVDSLYRFRKSVVYKFITELCIFF